MFLLIILLFIFYLIKMDHKLMNHKSFSRKKSSLKIIFLIKVIRKINYYFHNINNKNQILNLIVLKKLPIHANKILIAFAKKNHELFKFLG